MVRYIRNATRGLQMLGPTAVVLALAMSTGYATDASAACPTPPPPTAGPFFIDGVVGDTNGNACNNSGVGLGAAKVVDPAGSNKELGPVNSSATKVNVINTATPPMLDFTNPNSQVDLNTVYTQSAVLQSDLWFYFGWKRDSANGSGFIAIELEKGGVPTNCVYDAVGIDMVLPQSAAETALINSCNPWSARSGDGTPQNSDFLILWDQNGGSKDIYVRYFSTAQGKFLAPTLLNNAISAAEYSPDGFRGEAAVDLTAVVGGNPTSCLTFANIIPGTVTGNSDTADYKDTVLAAFPIASNCGVLNVKKITKDPDGNVVTNLTGTFRYTLNRSGGGDIRFSVETLPTPDNPCTSPGCVETLATSTRTFTAGDQTRSHVDLKVGTDYQLSEATGPLGTDWQFVNITCAVGSSYPAADSSTANPLQTIHVESSATTWCVITNQRVKGTPNESTVPTATVQLFDSISITGILPTSAATRRQSVTFGLYTDNTCTAANQIGVNVTADLAYNNAGTAATADTTGHGIAVSEPLSSSQFFWKVTYEGDSLNNKFITCGTATGYVTKTPLESTTVTVTHVH